MECLQTPILLAVLRNVRNQVFSVQARCRAMGKGAGMTQSTEQERALFEAVASDDGKWPQAIERDGKGNYLLLTTANGWMWWQAARRAPVVPQRCDLCKNNGGYFYGRTGYEPCCVGSLAPQPPDAAPVQMPEPVAKIEGGSLKWHIPDTGYSLPVRYLQGTQMLYTEHQVRQLLAAHSIQEHSA